MKNIETEIVEETVAKVKEALKLWRPVFYRTRVTDEDIRELDIILDFNNGEEENNNT